MMYAEICRDVFAPVYSVEDKPRLFGGNLRKTFAAKLVSSLVQDIGTGTPTFSRADATSCATVTDFEGIVRVVPPNCARFMGARLVRNLSLSRTDGDFSSWTYLSPSGSTSGATITFTGSGNDYRNQANGPAVIAGNTYVISATVQRGTKTGTIVLRDASAVALGSLVINLPTTETRFSYKVTAGSSAGIKLGFDNRVSSGGDGIAGSILVTSFQIEDVTGQANQNPSEYVSVGVLSAPYHGAGVDGIAYPWVGFPNGSGPPCLNGNTVVNNVVVPGTGASIKQGVAGVSATAPVDSIGPYGYLAEGSRQNLLLNSDIIGTNLSTQSITVTAAPWTVSFTGTGTITFTGTYTGSLVGSGATTRVQATFTPTAGSLTCTVTGTVKYAQAELGSFASAFIPTAASAVTRAADSDLYPVVGNISGSAGTVYLEFVATTNNGTLGLLGIQNAAGTEALSIYRNGLYTNCSVDTGGVTQASIISGVETLGTVYKVAMSWSANNVNAAFNGVLGTPDTVATMPDLSSAQIMVGGFRSGFQLQPFCSIRNVRIYPNALTSAQLIAITK